MKEITRREFIRLSTLATAGVAVAACAKTPEPEEEPTATPKPQEPTPKPKEPTPTPEPAAGPNQAPMLAEQTKAGTLPPAEERLPQNPYVAEVMESIGNYGGRIRRAHKGVSDRNGPSKHIDRNMIWYDRNLKVIPRMCESWELSDDATTWTWHLRKAMKWSDGAPFTSGDYMWHYDNVFMNEEMYRNPSGDFSTRDEEGNKIWVEFSAPDEYTLVMEFAHPKPLFIHALSRNRNFPFPGHYLAQYHMGLTDDRAALEAELKERGFETWQDLFNDYKEWYLHPERPNTYPWSAENSLHEELYIMVRNPYYFGTDPAGNQLPYLNNVHHRLYESQQVLNMRIVSGEIDFQNRHLSMADYTLYKENADKGEYQVFLGVQANHVAMQVNHTTQDEKLREFFQNQKVRIALSLACNRSEINELVYFGLYVPRQYSPLSMSPNYYPKLSNAYIEYDPDEADRLLDEAGYAEKDGDGFRLWKDGSGPVSFIIESSASAGSVDEDAVDLYIKHLAMVGIKAVHRPVERSLYTEHFESNQIEAAWWGGDRTVLPLAEDAQIFLGVQRDRPWAITWGSWRNDPTNPIAEEPPEGHWIKEMWRIWDEEIALEPDEDRQNAAFEKILDIWAEQIPFIGVLGEAPGPVIVKNGFRNYLDGVALDNTTADEHWLQTETYYWEEPDKHTG